MSKVVLDDVISGYGLSKINENFQKIEDELNNKVLYRDNPVDEINTIEQDLDLNGFSLYNVETINGVAVDTFTANVDVVFENIASVNTVATNIANVNIVAGIDDDVTDVAAVADDVSILAPYAPDVGAYATGIYTNLASEGVGKGASLVGYRDGEDVKEALDERMPEIGTYALLRAYTGPVTAFLVRGVANIFDGGFGVFRVNAGDTTTADNGGTVIVDANGRRWFREFSGAVNVRWFGAKGDGVADDTAAIQSALNTSTNVFIPAGTYKCTSALNVTVTGQVVYGAGRDLTTLDFSSSKINGLNMSGCEYARLENFSIIGFSDADTDTNAGINVINWARGTASNMRITDFSRGISWENASRGWMLGMIDMYFWRNRVAGALLHGNAHSCSFRGGEIAQGKYGVVIGCLNADSSINDDASANFGGAFSAHGTIIEGQTDYMVVVGNNQLGAKFSGCYIETVAATAPQAFFRIGSKFKNDGVTPATGYPKGVSVDGCMIYKGPATPQFAAVKLEALLGGSFIGNAIASAGPVLDFMDTSALRFSYGINSVGNEVSGGGNYVAGTSDAVSIGNREYPVTNSASGYLKQFYGWSGSAWEVTMSIPATSSRGPTFNKQPIFNGGIKLQNGAPTDNESMNYYKADVFTPTVIGSSTAGTATYSVQSGVYTRIGNRVFFDINLTYTGGTGTGNLRIAGLPFTTNASRPSALSIYASNLTYTGSLSALTNVNATTLSIYESDGSALAYDAAATLIISGSYWV